MDDRPLPLPELTEPLAGEWTDPPPGTVREVVIHGNEARPGDLFVGLPGESTHGQRFVDQAADRGARAAVVEQKQAINLPQFVVPDSLYCLQEMARRYRRGRSDLYVVGITGSCGKTTLKEMLADLLDREYELGKTPGNLNNHIGLPLTVLNRGRGEILVAEIATNAPGEIGTLTDWLRPHTGIITHVGTAHLEGLGSLDRVAHEKSQLLAGLPSDGLAFLPENLKCRQQFLRASTVRPRTVGPGPDSDLKASWRSNGTGTHLRLETCEIHLPFAREGLVVDASLAAAAARELGVDNQLIEDRLSEFKPLAGRGKIHDLGKCRIIDGTYNANPDSTRDALDRLADLPGPRLAILGDMLELGDRAQRAHRELGEYLNRLQDLTVFFVGEHGDAVQEGFDRSGFSQVDTVEDLPALEPEEYGSVLLKASRGIGLDQLLDRWIDTP